MPERLPWANSHRHISSAHTAILTVVRVKQLSLWPQVERILRKVERPSRYINHELNSTHKDISKDGLRIALAYPDTYEVGLPNMGLQILYEILNKQDDVSCERVYAPWHDMEAVMRERTIPLFTLES